MTGRTTTDYVKFCSKHGLNMSSSRHFINKGEIPAPQKGTPKIERINLIGWEIKREL